jgi:iron complex outermembrane receptor protein
MAASPRSPTTASSAASATAWSPASTSSTAASTTSNSPISAEQKGALLSSSIDRSKNTSLYVEDSFYFLPNVAAIAGTQFLYATRNRLDRFLSNGDQSGSTEFNIWSPKAGLLWNIDPTWQAFANISRSAEVPSFGESANVPGVAVIPFTSIQPQTATTYEIGTRMKRPDYAWELTAYRANIRNELQCLYSAFGNCNVTNADRTVHQGIEAGRALRFSGASSTTARRRTSSG